MTRSLREREKCIIYLLNDQFFTGVLHLFAVQIIFYANPVFKNCGGDQDVKFGYRLSFVLKHLAIVTKKKFKISIFFSYLHRKYQIQDLHKKSTHLKGITLINFHIAPRNTEYEALNAEKMHF